jgi:hypothetical protein
MLQGDRGSRNCRQYLRYESTFERRLRDLTNSLFAMGVFEERAELIAQGSNNFEMPTHLSGSRNPGRPATTLGGPFQLT